MLEAIGSWVLFTLLDGFFHWVAQTHTSLLNVLWEDWEHTPTERLSICEIRWVCPDAGVEDRISCFMAFCSLPQHKTHLASWKKQHFVCFSASNILFVQLPSLIIVQILFVYLFPLLSNSNILQMTQSLVITTPAKQNSSFYYPVFYTHSHFTHTFCFFCFAF